MRQPVSADRNAYDRYWFNGYDRRRRVLLRRRRRAVPESRHHGLRLEHRARGRAARLSRVAPRAARAERARGRAVPDRHPRADEEPARDVARNDTGISCDLLWIPRTANFKEGHQTSGGVGTGAMRMEATRFNQFGTWQGEIRYDGHTCAIDPRRVYGTKDRSWGVRPVGEPGAGGAPPTRVPQIFFLWAPLHWQDCCTHAGIFANEFGEMWHWDGMIVPDLREPRSDPGRGGSEHRAARGRRGADRLHPGHASRAARDGHAGRARRRAPADRARAAALLPHEGDRLLASHLGPRHVEGRARRTPPRAGRSPTSTRPRSRTSTSSRSCARRCGDRVGVGVLEQIALGPYRKYGFAEFLDMAR